MCACMCVHVCVYVFLQPTKVFDRKCLCTYKGSYPRVLNCSVANQLRNIWNFKPCKG